MTIKEFFEKKEKLVIHCDTEEKANKLLRKFDQLGKKWSSRESYLLQNEWKRYEEKTNPDEAIEIINFHLCQNLVRELMKIGTIKKNKPKIKLDNAIEYTKTIYVCEEEEIKK